MRHEARVCELESTLDVAGRTMAQVGCGILPVLAGTGEVVGVITDRDICLALTERNKQPSEVRVSEVVSGELYTCRADDDLVEALDTMRIFGVRRLPVVGEAQRLEGILSLDDVVLEARALSAESYEGPFYSDIARTLKGICGHTLSAVAL
jgi:CBS domain-containing protein